MKHVGMTVVETPERFPLGTPINRKPVPDFQPIVGRPGWWKHPFTGVEQYREPMKDLIWPTLTGNEE